MEKKLYLSTHSIGFKNRLKHVLKDISVTIHQGDRIALVGDNGVGKTTLLKIIANILQPTRGKLNDIGTIWYLPQLDLEIFNSNQEISEYLSRFIDDWWEVISFIEKELKFNIDVSRVISSLSGGELVKLHLGIVLYIRPNILLLDEPTNHLDIQAQEWLFNNIKDYPYSIVMVSHDVFFADRIVNRVWELKDGYIREFGGNVSFYREQKRLEDEARLRRYEVALKDKKRLNKSISLEERRQEKNLQVGIKSRQDRSVSRMDRGYLKSKAEVRAGQKKLMYESRVEDNKKLLNELEPQIKRSVIYNVPNKKEKSRDIVLDIRDSSLQVQDNVLIDNIRISINSGDRIGIIGANGVGKSQLLKMILSRKVQKGSMDINPKINIVYMDQTYSLVKPHLTILENMQAYNPKASTMLIRQKLREFLFWDDYQVNQLAQTLSGGQVARLAFAMLSLNPVDILLLDEPTNNLDISTQESIIKGLSEYTGALIVVSHSLDFLSRISIEDVYCIANKEYIKHPYNITDDRFYSKLLDIIGDGVIS
ncbi:MAG: hypothetical protein RLZZ223_387 [Candidatus Parcubacteria bacterium]|jgi:ATPase subunit of ABC transporter with duplicated ATPase domains